LVRWSVKFVEMVTIFDQAMHDWLDITLSLWKWLLGRQWNSLGLVGGFSKEFVITLILNDDLFLMMIWIFIDVFQISLVRFESIIFNFKIYLCFDKKVREYKFCNA